MAAKSSGLDDTGLLELLKGDEQKVQKIQKGISMDPEFESKFRAYTQALSEGKTVGREQVYQGLDGVVQQGEEFRALVGELNAEMSKYFNTYEESLGSITDKTLVEKLAKMMGPWGQAWSERRSYDRLKASPLKSSASQMLTHGKNIAEVVGREEQKMTEAYKQIKRGRIKMAETYKEAETKLDEWTKVFTEKSELVNQLTQELEIAEMNQRGELQQRLETVKLEYHNADLNKEKYTVILRRITEDAPHIDKRLEMYMETVKNLTALRTNTAQQVLHYADILPLTQEIIESAMAVKGADMYGQQIRATLAASQKMAGNATKQIAITTAKSLDAKNMTPEEFAKVASDLIEAAKIRDTVIARAKEFVEQNGDASVGKYHNEQ